MGTLLSLYRPLWTDNLLAKRRRAAYVGTSNYPMRCFAFDQFGPLSIRPCHGSTWAPRVQAGPVPATYHRTHGIRYFHGCYSLGDDQLWGVTRRRKGGDNTLAALKSIRAARPDGAPIYVIMDNLSANKTPAIRQHILLSHPDNDIGVCRRFYFRSAAGSIAYRQASRMWSAEIENRSRMA